MSEGICRGNIVFPLVFDGATIVVGIITHPDSVLLKPYGIRHEPL